MRPFHYVVSCGMALGILTTAGMAYLLGPDGLVGMCGVAGILIANMLVAIVREVRTSRSSPLSSS